MNTMEDIRKKLAATAAIKVARRTKETYHFRKKKVSKLSNELNCVYPAKWRSLEVSSALQDLKNTYTEDEMQHVNMCFSDLAAPMNSTMFLMSSKADRELRTTSRYISFEELTIEERIPDARSRFQYSEFVHESAKKIAKIFAINLAIRRNAVATILKYYFVYRARKNWKILMKERNSAARTLQYAFRRKKRLIKRRKEKEVHGFKCIVKIQSVMRRKLAWIFEKRYKSNEKIFRGIRLRIWVRQYVKRYRQRRGIAHRHHIFVRRMQSLIRGILWRRRLNIMRQAQIVIKTMWRGFWMKKYAPAARRILRAYRRRWLYTRVVRMQCLARKFLSRSHLTKKKLSLLPFEVIRASSELNFLRYKLEKASKKDMFYKIIGGEALDKNPYFISKLQKSQKLSLQLVTGIDDIPPEIGKPFSKTRITLAILSIFALDTSNSIDPIILEIVLRYSYLRPRISLSVDDSWKNLRNYRIEDLKSILEPTRSMCWRIYIQGRLPDILLVHASLTSLWLSYMKDKFCRATLLEYRVREQNPRRHCPHCMKPFATDQEFVDHTSEFYIIHKKSESFTTFHDRVQQLISGGFHCPNAGILSEWTGDDIFLSVALRIYKECIRINGIKISPALYEDDTFSRLPAAVPSGVAYLTGVQDKVSDNRNNIEHDDSADKFESSNSHDSNDSENYEDDFDVDDEGELDTVMPPEEHARG